MDTSDIQYEKELFSLIAQGEEVAFAELYQKVFPRFLPYLYKLLRSEDAVQDVLQDALVKFWIARHRLAEVNHPHAWLFRIVANEALRHLRQQGLQSVTKEKFCTLQSPHYTAVAHQTELDVSYRETKRIIGNIVANLSPRQKIIYQLNREQGFAVPQIAEKLNVSANYVRKTLSHTLSIIQKKLEAEGIFLPILLLQVLA